MDIFNKEKARKRVLIVGSGFGGIEIGRRLDSRKYEVLVLDRQNYLTFQPLLYQVATGGLEPDSVAYPLRKIFRRKMNVTFRVAEVDKVEPAINSVHTSIGILPYDILVLATGSKTNHFGMKEIQENSLSLKSVTDALDMRSFILQNFEAALLSRDVEEKKSLMNFIVAGAGPTGVEIAGALAELRNHVLPNDYPELDLSLMNITLVDASDKVLNVMSEYASRNAHKQLEQLGIRILTGVKLERYNGKEAFLSSGEILKSKALIWTAGVMGNGIIGLDASNYNRGNRILTDEYNKVKGSENIFAIGDVAAIVAADGTSHPMLAPVAMQQGKQLAANLNLAEGKKWKAFRYTDRGTMATIGRSRAVADLKFTHLKGFPAWIAWLFIHLMLLVGFRNRLVVLINWIWNYFSYDRAIRLIIRPYRKKESA
ncbi:MAG: NAD(P)/FAD-dependent oxidoreductase [Bacteroidetes bacterium]|nr:NAD(P)/FAD-dependent oxidoreductase [Bacteroidota bacterium]MBL0137629.1 NAD(P)/FAD-dependent oxidoreductase [Bacteroidota bacterium]